MSYGENFIHKQSVGDLTDALCVLFKVVSFNIVVNLLYGVEEGAD